MHIERLPCCIRHAIEYLARGVLLGAVLATTTANPATAAVAIEWWHAMSGELGRQLEKLTTEFNASQNSTWLVDPSPIET